MNRNNRIFSYDKKLPFYTIPGLFIGALLLVMVAIFFGILIGTCILLIAAGALIARLFFTPFSSKQKRVEDDGRTIILREDEYKVIDKKN